MKNFLEWLRDSSVYKQDILRLEDYEDFLDEDRNNVYDNFVKTVAIYAQPFSVDMLVNEVCDCIGECEENKKILFEGWWGFQDGIYRYSTKDKVLFLNTIENRLLFSNYIEIGNISLNDFITLCNLAGVELIPNPNNKQIKELGICT